MQTDEQGAASPRSCQSDDRSQYPDALRAVSRRQAPASEALTRVIAASVSDSARHTLASVRPHLGGPGEATPAGVAIGPVRERAGGPSRTGAVHVVARPRAATRRTYVRTRAGA